MITATKSYLTAKDLSEFVGISIGHAYKLIRKLNQELASQGYLVIAGKVSRKYFETRWYGFSQKEGSQ
jgi:hypothetical protein